MSEAIAWTLYLIGFAATATSPFDDPRLAATKPLLVTSGVSLAWPVFALIVVAHRLAGLFRNG